MEAQANAAKREAIETARQKVTEEKAKTEVELRALEVEKAQLQQQPEREAAPAHKEEERRAAQAIAAAMEEAERKIGRETPPGGFRVDTLRRFLDRDPSSRMKIDLEAGDSRSSEGSGPATRPRCKGQGKTLERTQKTADRQPHDSDPFVTCSDGDERNHRQRHEPTGCKVGAPGVGGGRGKDTPLSSGGEGLLPPYRGRKSTPGQSLPRFGPRIGDMDIKHPTCARAICGPIFLTPANLTGLFLFRAVSVFFIPFVTVSEPSNYTETFDFRFHALLNLHHESATLNGQC